MLEYTVQSEMLNLFATPLYRDSLGRAFSDAELQCFRNQLQQAHTAIANQASSNKRVLELPALQGLRNELQQHLSNYFQQVFNTSNDVQLKITQSWLSLTRKEESHHEHTHPNSVASGVLYINVGETDGINFYRNEDNIWHELLRKEENYYNAYRYFVQTQAGDVLIFPSNIRHGVGRQQQEIERVSLAFNSFFEGELGKDEFSNHLRIELK